MQRGNKTGYCHVLLQCSYLSDEKVPVDQGHEAKVGVFEHVVHQPHHFSYHLRGTERLCVTKSTGVQCLAGALNTRPERGGAAPRCRGAELTVLLGHFDQSVSEGCVRRCRLTDI